MHAYIWFANFAHIIFSQKSCWIQATQFAMFHNYYVTSLWNGCTEVYGEFTPSMLHDSQERRPFTIWTYLLVKSLPQSILFVRNETYHPIQWAYMHFYCDTAPRRPVSLKDPGTMIRTSNFDDPVPISTKKLIWFDNLTLFCLLSHLDELGDFPFIRTPARTEPDVWSVLWRGAYQENIALTTS